MISVKYSDLCCGEIRDDSFVFSFSVDKSDKVDLGSIKKYFLAHALDNRECVGALWHSA